MGLESSWSLMDIPLDARDAAQAAARREGLSLGEWLTRRILKRYSELSAQEREDAFNRLGHRVTEVADRLDRLEGSSRSEPLREAVKKLHQGLSHLSADFVRTTGQSTIQVSALARDLEDVLGKIEQIRGAVVETDNGFKQHIETVRHDLNSAVQKSERGQDALAQKLERLGQTFEDAFAGISRTSGALQSEVVRVAQDLQALDGRVNEAQQQTEEQSGRMADRVENFGIRLDRVCAATAETATSLYSRIQECQDKLSRFDADHSAQSATVTQRLETLDEKFAEAAADSAGMCGALDHRLLLVQQSLQSLDQRHAETAEALAKGRSWAANSIAEVRAESSSVGASLDAHIAATRRALDDVDQRFAEAKQALSESRCSHADTATAVRALQGGTAAFENRLSAVESNPRLSELEQGLSALAQRAEAAQAALVAQRDIFLERSDDLAARHEAAMQSLVETRRNHESAASAIKSLESRIAALQTSSADFAADSRVASLEQKLHTLAESVDAAQRALIAQHDDIVARSDNLAGQQNSAMQDLAQVRLDQDRAASALQSFESRMAGLQAELAGFAADSRTSELAGKMEDLSGRTQALETSLDLVQEHTKVVGDMLTSLDARTARQSSKLEDGLVDLKSELLEELSRSLSAQVDTAAQKQERALEELHANFAADTLKALEEKWEEGPHIRMVAASEADAAPLPAPAHVSFSAIEAQPPPVVTADTTHEHPSQDSILDLSTPLAEAHECEPLHETVEVTHEAPPLFAEPGLATAAAMVGSNAVANEPLEPAMIFANEPARDPVASTASFLSAARQSLQEAAQKSETISHPKSLFGFPFFRQSGPPNSRKNDTTSYALVAGVALVAMVAIAVATTELVKRSHPPLSAHRATTLAAARHVPRHPAMKIARAVAKVPAVTKATAAPRLEQLANAGDPQAQMLLGLQEIGTDSTDAAKWLGAAAQQGIPVAQYRIATLYAQGRGVPADAAKAFHWYAAAAKGGNRKAMSNLALDYAQGSGTAKDPQQAALWFSKAAALGLVDAQFDLAVLYERGLGVPQSLIDAYRWYLVAAKAGDRESKDRVDALSSQLSAQDRAAAETAAAQFKPLPMNTSANEPQ